MENRSRLLVFGIKDEDRIDVRWGDSGCAVNYQLHPQNNWLAYKRQPARCVPAAIATGAN
ncbi:hypothetical protein [Burkholderia sp. F1]|uniref:hypothetical protein n=1 Tax=Burkholderia sp. F1 TaxID=3366817 RepID=UPI003D71CA2B